MNNANRLGAPAASPLNTEVTFAQERLWHLEHRIPGACNAYIAIEISGELDLSAFEKSVADIVARHAPLRVTFLVGCQPIPSLNSSEPFTLSVADLREYPRSDWDAVVRECMHREARRRFDLCAGPLLQGTLLRFSRDCSVFVLSWHQIVADIWSIGVFFSELEQLYDGLSKGIAVRLSELPISYSDHALRQRCAAGSDKYKSLAEYWRNQLPGDTPVLQLPTDTGDPLEGGFVTRRKVLVIPAELVGALKSLSCDDGSTLSTLLLAALDVLLYRYTSNTDIRVGVPTATRDSADVEKLIGCFLNILVVRGDLSGNATFRGLLRQVQHTAREAKAHQEIPFEIAAYPDQPDNRVIQVMFAQYDSSSYVPKFSGLTTKLVECYGTFASAQLTFSTIEIGGELTLALDYDASQFKDETAARLLRHFNVLLRGIATNPDERIATLPILTQEERQQFVIDLNATEVPYPKDLCLDRQFEARVRQTPDNPALLCENQRLSYLELNRRANQLAWHLRDLGVARGMFVGLCMKRSAELEIGNLAILKAGGCCLMLDPVQPKERLAFMIKDAGAHAVLTQSPIVDRLALSETQIVSLDSINEVLATKAAYDLQSPTTTDDMAYVVYTSGSTGVPKGVLLSHRSAGASQLPETALYRLREDDRVLLPTYGLLMSDIFCPWLSGACAVIPSDAGCRDGAYLVDLIARNQVTVALLFPSMLEMLVGQEGFNRCTSLRYVMSMGEPLSVQLQERFFSLLRETELHNAYGQTEAGSTIYRCERGINRSSVPIGRPGPNTQVYLLDSHLQAVPIGVTGELYIGSANIAVRYLNRPELTAEKFIPHPFSNDPDARVYRTGDLARYLSDGNIEFLGRKDRQVKLRGFRVELEEIETTLAGHPNVLKAAVITDESVSGRTRLVAYIVPGRKPAPSSSKLRRFIKQILPDQMVPAVFVTLDTLPLMPNGKVDRSSLPVPANSRPQLEVEFVPPRTLVEQQIAAVWGDVLGVDPIGVHDNFFELGGDSLLATIVVSQLAHTFQTDPPSLFDASTPADLARALESRIPNRRASLLPPLQRVPRDGLLPLTPAQEHIWCVDRLLPGAPIFNMGLAIHIAGPLDFETLQQTLDFLTARHEALRTVITTWSEQPHLEIREQACVVRVIDLRHFAASRVVDEIARLIEIEFRQGFDLARGPLWRTCWLRITENDHFLLLTFHHVIADGWSIGVLWRELGHVYQACADGRSPQLPHLPFQFVDFAAWQRRCLTDRTFHGQMDYWERRLASPSPQLPLPSHLIRPAKLTFHLSQQCFQVPSELYESVKHWARREKATSFMALISDFAVLLYRMTGVDQITLTTLSANRTQPETEGIFGLLANTLLLRFDLSHNPTFRQLLRQIQRITLEASANQHLPFEELATALARKREFDLTRLCQVLFLFQKNQLDPIEASNFTMRTLGDVPGLDSPGVMPTTFDLIMELSDTRNGLTGSLRYKTELFDAETITYLLKSYEEILRYMVADPDGQIGDLHLRQW